MRQRTKEPGHHTLSLQRRWLAAHVMSASDGSTESGPLVFGHHYATTPCKKLPRKGNATPPLGRWHLAISTAQKPLPPSNYSSVHSRLTFSQPCNVWSVSWCQSLTVAVRTQFCALSERKAS